MEVGAPEEVCFERVATSHSTGEWLASAPVEHKLPLAGEDLEVALGAIWIDVAIADRYLGLLWSLRKHGRALPAGHQKPQHIGPIVGELVDLHARTFTATSDERVAENEIPIWATPGRHAPARFPINGHTTLYTS